MVLLAESSLVRCILSGAKVREGGWPEVRPRYREEFEHLEKPLENAHLVWRRHLAVGTELSIISTLGKQSALTRPLSPTTSAALADVEISAERSLSSPEVSTD